jgi:pimeloyl-ACP methyl ester carboxylesterase
MGDFAADAVGLLEALGIARAYVVGHSMGAAIALQMGADHPARVAGLAMLGAFSDFAANPAAVELAAEVKQFAEPVDPAFARAFQESTCAGAIAEGFLDMAIGESLKVSAHVWRHAANGMMASNLPDAARRCARPALIVWGERDAFCSRADQIALRARCGSSRMLTLAGVGHAVHWERPAEVAAALVAFVSELDGARFAA